MSMKALGKKMDGLYKLHVPTFSVDSSSVSSCNSAKLSDDNSSMLWHTGLGHSPLSSFKHLIDLPCKGQDTDTHICDVCHYAKQTRIPFPLSSNHNTHPFSLIHCCVGSL